jgi:GAF domain-containing protein
MARSGIDTAETPRAISFCTHTIEDSEPLIVEDARHDARFADNPLVTQAPYVRFYAGFPLDMGAGLRVGTLCVIDNRPRKLTATQIDSLLELAQTTVQWLLALSPRGGPR